MLQNCNACGDKLKSHLFNVRDVLTNEPFALKKCTFCGLGHTVPSPPIISRYYGETYYGDRHGFTSAFCIKRRLKFLGYVTKEPHGKKLLDIGCGDGSFLIAARDKKGWKVFGTEINTKSVTGKGLIVSQNVDQLNTFAPFDCITMWHSLEHLRDVKSSLNKLLGLLKPDGKLLIALPDSASLQSRIFRRHWFHMDIPRHLYHFDFKSLNRLIEKAGATIQHHWHHEMEYDLIGWSQSALNCIFPKPNLFIDCLTGKIHKSSNLFKILCLATGFLMTFLFLPIIAMESLANHGGTLIIAANKKVHNDNMKLTFNNNN